MLRLLGPGRLNQAPEIVRESELGRFEGPRWSLFISDFDHDGTPDHGVGGYSGL